MGFRLIRYLGVQQIVLIQIDETQPAAAELVYFDRRWGSRLPTLSLTVSEYMGE